MKLQCAALLVSAIVLEACVQAPVTPVAVPSAQPPSPIAATTITAVTAEPTKASAAVPTLVPTSLALSAPTSTPIPKIAFTQVAAGGCCMQPFFSPDGARVMFLDKPGAGAATGIYAVALDNPLSPPQFFNAHPGPYNQDMTLAIDLVNGATTVRRLAAKTGFSVNNGGRFISFSPDGKRMLWMVGEDAGGFDVRKSDITLANADGTTPQVIASRYGGGAVAWFADSEHLLLTGRSSRADKTSRFSVLNITDKSVRDLVAVERARSVQLSPDDKWLLYLVAQAQDEASDGTFIVSTNEQSSQPRRLPLFGSFRWCSPDKLLFVPLNLNAPSNELWVVDAPTGAQTQLLSASADSPFKILNGDWTVDTHGSPHIAFVNSQDKNIWVAALGNACSQRALQRDDGRSQDAN